MYLLAACMPAHAQYLSQNGNFEVDYIRGCAPLNVTITAVNYTGSFGSIVYDFEADGTTGDFDIATGHQYTAGGTYEIVQVIGTATTNIFDTLRITVYDPLPPDVTIDLCQGNEARMVFNDNYYNQYVVNWGDGTPDQVIPNSVDQLNHIYASQGDYPIEVTGLINLAPAPCGVYQETVTTLPALEPPTLNGIDVTESAFLAYDVTLDFSLGSNTRYELEVAENNASAFQSLGELENNLTSLVIDTLDLFNNYYCYRIAAVDPCTGNKIFSEILCTVSLNFQVDNARNILQWDTHTGIVTSYQLIKDGLPLQTFTDPTTTSYIDSAVVCDQLYCYRVIATFAGGQNSASVERCDVAFSTTVPPALQNLTATVVGNNVEISWPEAPVQATQYELLKRRAADGKYVVISTQTDTVYSDQNALDQGTRQQACYRIRYTDICDISAEDSPPACTIIFDLEFGTREERSMSWTAYQGWENGVQEYIVEKYDNDGNLLATYPVGNSLSFTDTELESTHQILFYRVVAYSADNPSRVAASPTDRVILTPEAVFPNAFTPNNDGLNDVFIGQGVFIAEFNMRIYNRWGELLFSSPDVNVGWDGTYQGKDVPPGVYVYITDIKDFTGRDIIERGTIQLIRK